MLARLGGGVPLRRLSVATRGATDLLFEAHYLRGLAQGSFVLAHDGAAFIVDPRRDVGSYLRCDGGSAPTACLCDCDCALSASVIDRDMRACALVAVG
jgi:hypothetical protein